jgi:hypothetical protein
MIRAGSGAILSTGAEGKSNEREADKRNAIWREMKGRGKEGKPK